MTNDAERVSDIVAELRANATAYAAVGVMDTSALLSKAASIIEAQSKALAEARAGWKLVPVKPTSEMLNAAIDVDSFKLGDISPLGFRISPQMLFEECYAAMLAACPKGEPQ